MRKSKTDSQLWLSWFTANRASDTSEMLLEMEVVAQLSSVKLHKFYKKHLRWRPFFVSPQACNCTKKDTITGALLWIHLCEYIFSFLLFCLRKDTSSHRGCFVKKGVLKNFANLTGKHLCWNLFYIKLHIFKNTYFEEQNSFTS